MKRTTVLILVATGSMALVGSIGDAGSSLGTQTSVTFAATDDYAGTIIDVCGAPAGLPYLSDGDGYVVAGEGETVRVSISPEDGPNYVTSDDILEWQVPEPIAEACCACGSLQGEVGCKANAIPCCCTADIQPDGSVYCECQGGKAC